MVDTVLRLGSRRPMCRRSQSLPAARADEPSWTEHYPELGTGMVSFEDSVSPAFYELEREAIFRQAWLNVGRIDDLPRSGSWFTKDLVAARTSVLVARDMDGEIRAFHNVCRHRGNKLVWFDTPTQEACGVARQFACKYHGWRYGLDGGCTYVHQENRVLRHRQGRARPRAGPLRGLGRIHLRERRRRAAPVAARVPRPDGRRARGLPVRPDDRALLVPGREQQQLEGVHRRLPGVLPRASAAHAPARTAPPQPGGRLRRRPLPARRTPPRREHERVAQAQVPARAPLPERGAVPQRQHRSVGRADARPRTRRGQPRQASSAGASTTSRSSRTSRS